jgi:hypothetical protein
MATVNLVVPTNTPYNTPTQQGLSYYRINEGTGVVTSFSVDVTISVPQAEDTIVTLGISGLSHTYTSAPGTIIYYTGHLSVNSASSMTSPRASRSSFPPVRPV